MEESIRTSPRHLNRTFMKPDWPSTSAQQRGLVLVSQTFEIVFSFSFCRKQPSRLLRVRGGRLQPPHYEHFHEDEAAAEAQHKGLCRRTRRSAAFVFMNVVRLYRRNKNTSNDGMNQFTMEWLQLKRKNDYCCPSPTSFCCSFSRFWILGSTATSCFLLVFFVFHVTRLHLIFNHWKVFLYLEDSMCKSEL